MKTILENLFNFQRFENQEDLAGIISDVESRYGHALEDDDLEFVSAAGEFFTEAEFNRKENM